MAERENLSRLSLLALRKRREGLTKVLPPLGEILRGSLMERYLTCGHPECKCARGERHGPVWYLSVTLDQRHRAEISNINRELLRRRKHPSKAKKKAPK